MFFWLGYNAIKLGSFKFPVLKTAQFSKTAFALRMCKECGKKAKQKLAKVIADRILSKTPSERNNKRGSMQRTPAIKLQEGNKLID